jgi:hypothetical protein
VSISSKIREVLKNKNGVEFTSSDDDYKQWRQQVMQPYVNYTKAAMSQGNQGAMQVLMDNPGTWVIDSASVNQNMYDGPQNVMDMEMKIRFFDPNVCQQFYGVLSGVIQGQPVGMGTVWNPSLTITVPRLDEDDEDEDTKSSFRTQDEGKYVTSFKEAM